MTLIRTAFLIRRPLLGFRRLRPRRDGDRRRAGLGAFDLRSLLLLLLRPVRLRRCRGPPIGLGGRRGLVRGCWGSGGWKSAAVPWAAALHWTAACSAAAAGLLALRQGLTRGCSASRCSNSAEVH